LQHVSTDSARGSEDETMTSIATLRMDSLEALAGTGALPAATRHRIAVNRRRLELES